MVSLKEIKGRIASVSNTRKLTSAMKQIASAKLHKAEGEIGQLRPYQEAMHRLLLQLLQLEEGSVDSPFVGKREVRRVAVVAFASNGSLCGGFNANVLRRLTEVIEEYRPLGRENLLLYVAGSKVADEVRKLGFPVREESELAEKPDYAKTAVWAQSLADAFVRGEIDRVELLYPHFQSAVSQPLVRETYLPMQLSAAAEPLCPAATEQSSPAREESTHPAGEESTHPAREESTHPAREVADYLVEPSPQALLQELLPKALRLQLYTVLLDSRTAEHAARTLAMQTATDNANEMLQELTLQYHKSRQQAITNELLDIMGGSMA